MTTEADVILQTEYADYVLTIVQREDLPAGQARAVVTRPDGEVAEQGVVWAYQAWTVAAHFDEIVARIERETPRPCIAERDRAGSAGSGGEV